MAQHTKAGLCVDFADFRFFRFDASEAHLNAGFGRAPRLSAGDLGL